MLLPPHSPGDDSPEAQKAVQSAIALHNFLVEKVIMLLENADQRSLAFRNEGFRVISPLKVNVNIYIILLTSLCFFL